MPVTVTNAQSRATTPVTIMNNIVVVLGHFKDNKYIIHIHDKFIFSTFICIILFHQFLVIGFASLARSFTEIYQNEYTSISYG